MGHIRVNGELKHLLKTTSTTSCTGHDCEVIQQNRQSLHLNDNSKALNHTDANCDKLFKLCPLLDKLIVQFQNEGVSTCPQSTDEAMILFKGRHSMKQFMLGKPVKRGYKPFTRYGCDVTRKLDMYMSLKYSVEESRHHSKVSRDWGHKL